MLLKLPVCHYFYAFYRVCSESIKFAAICLSPLSDVVGTKNIVSFVMLIYARMYLLAFNVVQDFHTTPAPTPTSTPTPSRLDTRLQLQLQLELRLWLAWPNAGGNLEAGPGACITTAVRIMFWIIQSKHSTVFSLNYYTSRNYMIIAN